MSRRTRDWMGAFRNFGGATEKLRHNWSQSSTPHLDTFVRITGVITAFIGAWVVLGMAFAPDPGAYVPLLVTLVVINIALLGFRAWKRRRQIG